jgi:hypothetical protein
LTIPEYLFTELLPFSELFSGDETVAATVVEKSSASSAQAVVASEQLQGKTNRFYLNHR